MQDEKLRAEALEKAMRAFNNHVGENIVERIEAAVTAALSVVERHRGRKLAHEAPELDTRVVATDSHAIWLDRYAVFFDDKPKFSEWGNRMPTHYKLIGPLPPPQKESET